MASLRSRVNQVAEAALAQRRYVSPVEVFTRLGWLRSTQVDQWQQGRVAALEQSAAVDGARLREAAELLREWAQQRGLESSETAYLSSARDREPLAFVRSGDDPIFRIHWLAADLTPARREQLVRRQNKAPDLMVVAVDRPFACVECAGVGSHQIMSAAGPLCVTCADLDHLEFLPAGDATLSRRAKKESTLAAVVVRLNPRRKRYERQGILVEEQALARAEQQCLADEEARERRRGRDRVRRDAQDVEFQARFAAEIQRLFPGCPAERATEIAEHAALRGSGRVGRSAAAKVFDADAVTLAVIASVRHRDTAYDRLLMDGVARMDARAAIRADLDRVLESWRG
ncbi:DUF2293 domain-containing protein [Nocardia sp. alder85J]|uniref:DUF2293 domain-containing protein n=1 Tax=Nocardia sp. alder85J TaxID=2862949 RepID=UPI001CD36F4B|nr:DUF2293 domain-containing protein [Nocardia sp. alder85J]MCX4094244.1 DUF2293 domain-containing protein [Nocardia sp. alder85J]